MVWYGFDVADTLVINEIFHSIQGESSYAGLPCVFVRLTACNLRCTWCDTTYSFHEGAPMKVSDVIVKVLDIVGLRRQQLLQDERRSVCLQRPDFHLSEALATKLRLAAQRLLGDERVRSDGSEKRRP